MYRGIDSLSEVDMSRFHLYGLHNMAAEAGGCYQVDRELDIRRGLMN